MDSICHQTKSQLSTQALPQFSTQFQSFLRNNLSVLQKNINIYLSQNRNIFGVCIANTQAINDFDANETLLTIIEETVIDSAMPIVKMNAMCIFYHHLFGNLDQKLFAAVIDTNKKVRFIRMNIIMCGHILFSCLLCNIFKIRFKGCSFFIQYPIIGISNEKSIF